MKRSMYSAKLTRNKSSGSQKKPVVRNEYKEVVLGKYSVTKTETNFEEDGLAGLLKKKENYQTKLSSGGRHHSFSKIQRAVRPRIDEKIYQKKKKVEYLDNYQYHETKNIKNKDPNKVSQVHHKRKGNIVGVVGGTLEQNSYQKRTMINPEKVPKLYSSQTTRTTTTTTRKKAAAPSRPYKPPLRSNSVTKSLSITKSREREVTKSSSYAKGLRRKPSAKISYKPLKPATKPTIKPSYRPAAKPTTGSKRTRTGITTKKSIKTRGTKTTTSTTSKSNRSHSTGRGKKH